MFGMIGLSTFLVLPVVAGAAMVMLGISIQSVPSALMAWPFMLAQI